MTAVLDDIRRRRAARSEGADRVSALMTREGQALLGYFARRVLPREDAADLLSETFGVIWRRAADLPSSDDEARMWAYGIARRVLASHRRGQRRRSALTEQLRSELAAEGGVGSTPVVSAEAEHAAALVRALPSPDREILMLLHWDGFTLAEIARLLRMPAGTVRSRYARTRAALKLQLDTTT